MYGNKHFKFYLLSKKSQNSELFAGLQYFTQGPTGDENPVEQKKHKRKPSEEQKINHVLVI
jgi:hypothetical protein